MTDDITETLAPNSTQLDAVDLLGGPRIFTVTKVDVTGGEQPVAVHFAEFDRPWKPSKNMRRALGFCWSTKSSTWVGRRVELFCDTEVMFGGKAVGGIRIKRLSDIGEPMKVPQILTRGKSGVYVVQPLPDLSRRDQLAAEWKTATPERRAEIEAEMKQPQDSSNGGEG